MSAEENKALVRTLLRRGLEREANDGGVDQALRRRSVFADD